MLEIISKRLDILNRFTNQIPYSKHIKNDIIQCIV